MELVREEEPKDPVAAGIKSGPAQFLAGQLVAVRGLDEIRATLDDQGRLDGVPFMPEMRAFCGGRFRVYRRADKTCVEGYGVRLMGGAVFLENVRCDGSAHDGCQRNCLIFWKDAWLKPVDDPKETPPVADLSRDADSSSKTALITRKDDRYFCQSTELYAATRPLSRWNLLHFATDFRRGELSLGRFIQIFARMAANRLRRLLGLRKIGSLAGRKQASSRGDLDLRPGEWVEVKSAAEIESTLDSEGKNRGLTFEPDMLEYCGRRFQVDFPIQKIILEETGKLIPLSHTVALKGVFCQGLCAKNCPRSNPLYWRETWLRRVE